MPSKNLRGDKRKNRYANYSMNHNWSIKMIEVLLDTDQLDMGIKPKGKNEDSYLIRKVRSVGNQVALDPTL